MPVRPMPIRKPVKARKGEEFEYRVLLAVTYPLFLVGAVLGRILMLRRRATASRSPRLSVFGEARVAAQRCVPFAFMG